MQTKNVGRLVGETGPIRGTYSPRWCEHLIARFKNSFFYSVGSVTAFEHYNRLQVNHGAHANRFQPMLGNTRG